MRREEGSAKKDATEVYERPQVTLIGTVAELTKSGSSSGGDSMGLQAAMSG